MNEVLTLGYQNVMRGKVSFRNRYAPNPTIGKKFSVLKVLSPYVSKNISPSLLMLSELRLTKQILRVPVPPNSESPSSASGILINIG
jgi:hypothetical protein